MKYLVRNVRLGLNAAPDALKSKVAKKIGIPPTAFTLSIYRESIDARKGTVQFNMHVIVETDASLRPKKSDAKDVVPYEEPTLDVELGSAPLIDRPVVVGLGPCGLFTALLLAKHGYRPIVLERGRDIESRTKDVDAFWSGGALLPNSNVQFGEGGAGAFSDGKLTSRSKDPRVHTVLKTFVDFGAPEEILYQQYPHIGTDILVDVVRNMRNEIIRLGGEVRFETQLKGFACATKTAVDVENMDAVANPMTASARTEKHAIPHDSDAHRTTAPRYVLHTDKGDLMASAVVLAIGHSARDTFYALHDDGLKMENKPFAVGFRIEHPQSVIDENQYGADANSPKLPRASYRLTYSAPQDRGVYTFCMCPGGYVVNASSEEGRLCVNGMSYHARGGTNANSAVITTLKPEDLGDALFSGIEFQRKLEESAFALGGGNYCAPVQRVEDFLKGIPTTALGFIQPSIQPGYKLTDLSDLYPTAITEAIRMALKSWDHRVHGFANPDAILTGVEARSSSPIRIVRDPQSLASISHPGIYPAGEGAGYAGGIVSSAVDGIKAALQIIEQYSPINL